jgi:hypothetical protein
MAILRSLLSTAEVPRSGKTAQSMKENGSMVKLQERALSSISMVTCMKESSGKTEPTGKALTITRVDLST